MNAFTYDMLLWCYRHPMTADDVCVYGAVLIYDNFLRTGSFVYLMN